MSSAYSSAVVGGKLKLKRPGAGPAAAAAPVAKPAAPVTAPPKPAAPAPPAPAKSPVPAAPESFAGTKRKADDTAVPSEVVPAAKAPRLDSDSGAGAAEAPAASAPAAKVIKVEDLGLKGLTASERAHAERMLQRVCSHLLCGGLPPPALSPRLLSSSRFPLTSPCTVPPPSLPLSCRKLS